MLSEGRKESFHQIDPRAVGWRKVAMKSWMAQEPILYLIRFVCAIVIQDQVDVQVSRNLGIDMSQEADEFRGSMSTLEFADYFATGDIQCREQSGCPISPVVMRVGFG